MDRTDRRLWQACNPVFEGLEVRKHLDANTVQQLPFILDFSSDRGELVDKDGQGTGFTRVQVNSLGNQYQPQLIDLDTAAGVLKLTTTGNGTNGGNSGTDNTLVNALETQFDGTTSGFTIQARLKGPLSYMNDPYEQGGIYFGPDQDNYVKLVAIRTLNGNFIQFRDEQNATTTTLPSGSQAQEVSVGSFASINTLDLRLVGDAASGRVSAYYSINGAGFVKIPADLTLTGTKKTQFFNAASRAGLIAFHKNNVGPITVTFDSFQITAGTPITGRPSVTGTRPGHLETNVSRDIFIAADVNLPNVGGGVDSSTLNTSTVRLRRTSDGALIPGTVDTTGGGDAIVYQPLSPLDANTNYTFEVTEQLKDTTGAAFIPFTMSFTTGTSGGTVDTSVSFEKLVQSTSQGQAVTGLKFGPDGKLYATTIDGKIIRFTKNPDGTLGSGQVINTIINREGGPRMTLSIAFDPSSTANNLIAYISHGQYAGLPGLALASNFTGKITKVWGPNLENSQDVVVGLPRSVKDHQNYQAVFGPDGKLYVNVSSMSAMGAPDNAWGLENEVLLSASILQIDVNAIGTQTINVRTEGVATPYNPFATNAPVKIYARGLRSAYDILFHSNGHMYSATNGSAAGGNTPAKPGVSGTGLNNVSTQNDYMFRIVQNGYYGHPNPLRNEYILNGGNPTSGNDPGEIVPTPERPAAYPVGTQPESTYRGFVYDFGKNYSPNGMIEYQGNAFGGALNGKILIVRYSGGDDILVLTPNADGSIASAKSGYAGFTGFIDPLDITQDPATGYLYVAEYGGQRITLLRPIAPGGANIDIQKRDYYFNDVINNSSTTTGNRQTITIRNTGTGSLSISQLVFGGTDASNFSLVNAPATPIQVAAGGSVNLTVAFTASTTGVKTGTLTLVNNDPDTPNIVLNLRGLGTAGEGGTNEPSLQRIFDLYFGTNTIRSGDNDGATVDFPATLSTPNDEVVMPRLQKAGSGPVTIEVLANFANSVSPSSRFGWYEPGNVGAYALNRLFNVGQTDAQSVNVTPQGVTSFDPGAASFGIYGQFPAFTDRIVYSEDSLNAWETNSARKRKVRFYTLKNSDGTVVPNAFIFTFEEYNVSYDQNDLVGIIRNVKAAPAGPEIGFENRDGAFLFPDRLVMSNVRVLDPDYPNVVHDRATLRINNSGSSALNITSITSSSSDFVIESGGGASTIAAGGFKDVVIRFTYLRQANGNEIRSGTLTIQSDDADEPTKTVELRGLAQSHSEDAPSFGSAEPSAATLINLFGFTTKIVNSGQNMNTGGAKVRVGEEIFSEYWQRAETGIPVTVRMLAAYHQQKPTTNSVIKWFYQTSTPPSSSTTIFKHWAPEGQTILPRIDVTSGTPTAPAQGTFSPNTTPFGFKVDAHYTVDSFNTPNSVGDAGHAFRFYQAKDRNGKVIPNTYIMLHDYVGLSFSNYDYQDNIYIVSNVKPLSPPSAPTGMSASGSGAGIFVNWNDSPEGNVIGYNIYRSNASNGTFTKLNSDPVAVSQFTDILAPAGQTSFYRVTAVDYHGGESAYNTTSALRPNDTVPPAAPTGLTALGSSSGISLNWDDNSETDLAGYNIYRSSSSGGPYTKLNSSLRTVSDYIDTGAPSGATSFYRVTAVDSSGNESTFASISAFRPVSGSTPAAASGATATALSPTSVRVNWTDNSGNETGFRIERRLASSSTYTSVGTAGIDATQFTDNSASAGTAYVYRVIAYNLSGDAVASNDAAVTTPTNGPAAPSNLAATAIGVSSINLMWQDNSSNETGFRVEYRKSGEANYTTLATLAAGSVAHTATGLLESTTYVFRVVAFNAQGDSAPSNEATATTTGQFTSAEIGNPLPPGSTATVTNGTDYDLAAGGADIWGTADSFRFAYKQIDGDFDIRVRVTSVDATHATAPAGIMARASLASSSINAIMRTDASYRFRFGYRTTTGGTTAASGANVGTAGNTYLRLTRVGNVFTGWESSNGVNWTQTGSITLNVGSTMFVGLAAASKNTSATTTARFREYTEVGSTPTAPNAPSGLTAGSMASDQVNLMWNDNSTNEVAFRIERKVGSGSFATLTTVAANQTSFVDSTVSAGETYTYRVIAVGAAMDSAPSNEATITVAQQDPYTNVDINSVPAGARTPLVSGVDYDITGGGADVWGTSDSFNFSYRQITGDFDIAVRVTGVQATHATAMAGLMARASLDANSRNIFMRTDASQRFRFAYRSSTGGTTTAVGSDTGTAGNTWVRLQRVGNVFTGYQSSDGVNWTVTGTITMSLPSTLLVGMAVCSKNTSVATVANFRSLSLIQ